MSDLTLDQMFKMSGADAGVCCLCGSLDENFVQKDNGVLVTATVGKREQFFAAHRTCFVAMLHDAARTGPIMEPEYM